MAYSELIKNFECIRDYMRQFYVYGFKNRSEYDAKSARSYDNERRRIESWMGDYMSFHRDAGGKNVFLSVDSLNISANPLYQAFKAKSFTPGDITFHFYILDILADGKGRSVREILEETAQKYLFCFQTEQGLDESTVRKKLKEYEGLGLLKSEKHGRELFYNRAEDCIDLESWREAIAFFSEEDPLGVIGSYLLDKTQAKSSRFSFKHHYILHALDSEVLCSILLAISENRCAELTVVTPRSRGKARMHTVFPWKMLISTQTGRQYMLCYHYRFRRPMTFRLDNLCKVKAGAQERQAKKYGNWCEKYRENLWGVATGVEPALDHLEMTIHVDGGEEYIVERLEREKRCGSVEAMDPSTYRFSTDVYDAAEMLPWLRTFIGRIVKFKCTNPDVVHTFYSDLAAMGELYGGDEDAVQ
ncbi:hypothetical protein OBV_31890 [Oscillibacter valericigenes Sjm18-20]|nr:hypothetical protein OBV_31890 [Oscillibacter valericigenes Sjm18-20]